MKQDEKGEKVALNIFDQGNERSSSPSSPLNIWVSVDFLGQRRCNDATINEHED